MMASIDTVSEHELIAPLQDSPIFTLGPQDNPNLCRFESERYTEADDRSPSAKRSFEASLGLVSAQRQAAISLQRATLAPSNVVKRKPKYLPGMRGAVGKRDHDDYCAVCKDTGQLLMCDTCPRVYHLECAQPPLQAIPSGFWTCSGCAVPDGRDKFRRSVADMGGNPSDVQDALQAHMKDQTKVLDQAKHSCVEERKRQKLLQQERLQLTTAVQTYTTQLGELAGLSHELQIARKKCLDLLLSLQRPTVDSG
eukprot:m.18211 g.18211  ORF g.18211 m.18211 type:complete len:253 (+) comp10772_c0_seq1:75-833(+)